MTTVRMSALIVCVWAAVAAGQTTRATPADTRPAGAAGPAMGGAAAARDLAAELHARTGPSLVVVQYVWDSEAGSRELAGLGVVVRSEGVVMTALAMIPQAIPDAQLKDFKIIVPKDDQDDQELEAVFMGRDERTSLAFFKTRQKQNWPAVTFKDLPAKPGDTVYSVGLLPKLGGYRSYLAKSTVAATLKGEVPWVLVLSGGLSCIGSPVFNADGQAIGFVNGQANQQILLHDSGNDKPDALAAINNPPNFFIPAHDFLLSLGDLPTPGQPLKLPWVGISQMNGLKKDVAELFGVGDAPAVEIGEVIPGSAAEKAGLKRQMVIVKVNGQPLERGDEARELPVILSRKLLRMKVRQKVTFTVLTSKDEPPQDIEVTLDERPKTANLAERYFAQDLGFATRNLVFADTYRKRLAIDQPGVLVAWVKPQGAAEAGKLKGDDLIVEFNRQKVTDVADFKKQYEEFRKATPQEAVVMVVKREGTTQVIRIEPPQ